MALCSPCGGSGMAYSTSYSTCGACSGTGQVPDLSDEESKSPPATGQTVAGKEKAGGVVACQGVVAALAVTVSIGCMKPGC